MTSINRPATYSVTENSAINMRANKKHVKTDLEGRTLSQKAFQPIKNGITVQRTFGDISNRLNSNILHVKTEKTKFQKNMDEQNLKFAKGIKTKSFTPIYSPFSGPEIMIDFEEIEDYGDVLPPSMQLNDVTIRKCLQCWNKKNVEREPVPRSPSPPSYLFDLIPVMEGPPITMELEPLFEDTSAYDEPPPPFMDF